MQTILPRPTTSLLLKSTVCIILTGALYVYAPWILYPLKAQNLVFLPLGTAALFHICIEETGQVSWKLVKPFLWISLLSSFILSLQPWVIELKSLCELYRHLLNKTHSHWEAFQVLHQILARKSHTLTLIWGTWGTVTLALGLGCIATFKDLLLNPLKTEADRATKGPWKSSFMETSKIKQLAHNEKGLPLGRHKGKLLRYQSDPHKGWLGGHHAIFAGSRAGKGVSCVIPAILDHDGPVVCLDIKGENFAVTKTYRESLGRKVVVLNPFAVIEASQDTFNPLDYIRSEHLYRDLYVIADGLVKPETGMNTHFSDLVRDLLSGAIEVLTKQNPETSLNDVTNFFIDPKLPEHLVEWAQDPDTYGVRPSRIATSFMAAGDKEQGSILTTLQRNTNWMAAEEMKPFLSSSSFSLDDLLDNKIDLFIVVPMDILKQQENYLRLFTNLVLGTVIRQDGYRKADKPILLILDEFTRLGKMEKFLDIATVAAGCGIEAMFVAQDKGQVDQVWGKESTGTILGSCATVRAFGLGRTDSLTAKWVQEQLGDTTILTQSKSKGSGKAKPSQTTSEHKTPLMTASQIQELSPQELFCFIRSHKVLKLDRVKYYDDRAYKEKVEKNPLV